MLLQSVFFYSVNCLREINCQSCHVCIDACNSSLERGSSRLYFCKEKERLRSRTAHCGQWEIRCAGYGVLLYARYTGSTFVGYLGLCSISGSTHWAARAMSHTELIACAGSLSARDTIILDDALTFMFDNIKISLEQTRVTVGEYTRPEFCECLALHATNSIAKQLVDENAGGNAEVVVSRKTPNSFHVAVKNQGLVNKLYSVQVTCINGLATVGWSECLRSSKQRNTYNDSQLHKIALAPVVSVEDVPQSHQCAFSFQNQ